MVNGSQPIDHLLDSTIPPNAHLVPQETLLETTSLDWLSFPEPQQAFSTTIAVDSTRSKPITLPFDCQLATVELFTPVYETEFQEAAQTTAKQLADSWQTFVSLTSSFIWQK